MSEYHGRGSRFALASIPIIKIFRSFYVFLPIPPLGQGHKGQTVRGRPGAGAIRVAFGYGGTGAGEHLWNQAAAREQAALPRLAPPLYGDDIAIGSLVVQNMDQIQFPSLHAL